MLRILILLILFIISSQERIIGQENIYIKAGLLYDSKENKLLKNKLIHIRGTKIITVSEFESLPKNKWITLDENGKAVSDEEAKKMADDELNKFGL